MQCYKRIRILGFSVSIGSRSLGPLFIPTLIVFVLLYNMFSCEILVELVQVYMNLTS